MGLLLIRYFKVIESYAVPISFNKEKCRNKHVSQTIQLPTGKTFPVLLLIKKSSKIDSF